MLILLPSLIGPSGESTTLLTTDGLEKNTIQHAPDGINCEIKAVLKGTPEAIGLFRGLNREHNQRNYRKRVGECGLAWSFVDSEYDDQRQTVNSQ